MAKFEARTTAPQVGNSYFFGNGNIYNDGENEMPNCTAYAFGRFWEIRGGSAPRLTKANAGDWWDLNKSSGAYSYGSTPELGAIICWKKPGSWGHVAIVEDVKENGDIMYSESWYEPAKFFATDTTTKSSGYKFTGGSEGYIFQGFIYCGIKFDNAVTSTTSSNASIANQILNPTSRKMTTAIDEKLIWQYLILKIKNPYGVAGLMGNLFYESSLSSINLQGSYEDYLGYSDLSYTQAVDNGSYSASRFSSDEAGYGLAQWTSSGRKANLYNYCKSRDASIGNVTTQLEFLYNELAGAYSSVLSVLKNATSVKEASNEILFYYEIPADQSSSVQNKRASKGSEYYEKYSSITATSLGSVGNTSSSSSSTQAQKTEIDDNWRFYFDVLLIGDAEV